jgi:L-fuculose-phosphate aldolase
MREIELRRAIVARARDLNRLGLNQGTSGNISVRRDGEMLITPSGVPAEALTARAIARMNLDGDGAWSGPSRPSSEWRFHLDILNARSEAGAVVHAHPPCCTAFAMLRRPLRATHYMIAAFGGADVRCVDYAPFGTAELSALAVEGLRDRHAVLLANHGMIAIGRDLDEAMWRAVELEALARQTWIATTMGTPVALPDEEIARTIERFRSYGPKAAEPGRDALAGEITGRGPDRSSSRRAASPRSARAKDRSP